MLFSLPGAIWNAVFGRPPQGANHDDGKDVPPHLPSLDDGEKDTRPDAAALHALEIFLNILIQLMSWLISRIVDAGLRALKSLWQSLIEFMRSLSSRIVDAGKPALESFKRWLSSGIVAAGVDAIVNMDTGIDDRKWLLEEVLIFLSKLPRGSWLSTVIENRVVELFYRDLPHPPSTFLGRTPLLSPFLDSGHTSPTVSPQNSILVAKSSGNGNGAANGHGNGDANSYDNGDANSHRNGDINGHGNRDTNGNATGSESSSIISGMPNGYTLGANNPAPRGYSPPDAFSGKPYAHRMPDGSNNNPLFPDFGRAGMPYARSVPPSHPVPLSALPDPGVVFDVLLKRKEFKEHPTQISSLFFAFANIIIHSLFRTSHTQNTINETSSYLDLSPLYGHNEVEQKRVRISVKDGRGLLKEDTFADERLVMMPEASGALLVLFCRNHNYIARRILLINEHGKFKDPTPEWQSANPRAVEEQDDEIFNKARLVNCGYFMQIILGDYLGSILGTVREGSNWCLDPLQSIRTLGRELVPRGEGNVISVEFNLLYRWHTTLSKQDADWLEKDVYGKIFPGKKPETITKDEFIVGVRSWKSKFSKDPGEWDFGSLKRQSNGRFKDDDLARVMKDATTNVAGAFGARGTPPVLRVVEMMAIEQARAWGVCSLNEFRKFMGLKPYSSFKEWNPDPKISKDAMRLYGDIEHLELYVGLQAEEAKTPRPGAGLCPGFTISRAILADAVCLVRGDRFLTTDLTPFNLSSWGYQDCARELNNGSFGGQLSKLLMRTLPEHYNDRSTYAHFPMITPPGVRSILEKLDLVEKYDTKMNRGSKKMQVVQTAAGCRNILTDLRNFPVAYTGFLKDITGGHRMDLAQDAAVNSRRDRIHNKLFKTDRIDRYAVYFLDKTRKLIEDKSYRLGDSGVHSVDIVRDVVNLVPVHWVSEHVAGISLKTHTEMEMYQRMAVMFEFMFLNTRPVAGWNLREQSIKFSQIFVKEIKAHLQETETSCQNSDSEAHRFLCELCEKEENTEPTYDDLAYGVLETVVASVPDYGQAAAHIINFYLQDDHRVQKEDICRLALRKDDESYCLLTGYVLEALRLDPQTPGTSPRTRMWIRVQASGLPKIRLNRGERVFVSLASANVDPKAFDVDCAHTIDPKRAHRDYLLFRHGAPTILNDEFLIKTMPRVIRAVFSLKNIRRAPGRSGQLNRFTVDWHGAPHKLYVNAKGSITPWPESLVIQYDV